LFAPDQSHHEDELPDDGEAIGTAAAAQTLVICERVYCGIWTEEAPAPERVPV
jgi:hypothetical protein